MTSITAGDWAASALLDIGLFAVLVGSVGFGAVSGG